MSNRNKAKGYASQFCKKKHIVAKGSGCQGKQARRSVQGGDGSNSSSSAYPGMCSSPILIQSKSGTSSLSELCRDATTTTERGVLQCGEKLFSVLGETETNGGPDHLWAACLGPKGAPVVAHEQSSPGGLPTRMKERCFIELYFPQAATRL